MCTNTFKPKTPTTYVTCYVSFSLVEKPLASLGQSALLLATYGAAICPGSRIHSQQSDMSLVTVIVILSALKFGLLSQSTTKNQQQLESEASKQKLTSFRLPSSSQKRYVARTATTVSKDALCNHYGVSSWSHKWQQDLTHKTDQPDSTELSLKDSTVG